jgi:hypothetical protein
MEKPKWVDEPVKTSSTAAPGDKSTANEKWYPDHAVYNATKDQLKAMPQFKYD